MGSLRHCPVRRFGGGSGAHDRAVQAGQIIRLRARLAIFFVWTFPTNQATNNWTVVPKNWNKARIQQYSHAANAMVTFAALVCVVIAVLRQPSQAR
jgi:hypothetical protein